MSLPEARAKRAGSRLWGVSYVLSAATVLLLWTRHTSFENASHLLLEAHLGPFVLGAPPGTWVPICILWAAATLTFLWRRTAFGAATSALGTITWLAAGTFLLAATWW